MYLFRNILLCLLLLAIPSAAFAHWPPMFVIIGGLILFICIAFCILWWLFLLFKLVLTRKFGVVKTPKHWWQCFGLSIVIWIGLKLFISSFSTLILIIFPWLLTWAHTYYFYILISWCLMILLPFLSFYISHKIIK